MKQSVVLAFIFVAAIAGNCVSYGSLEAAVNMAEGLPQLFRPGATTVLFSPFLLLFILLMLATFIALPLLAAGAAALFGGLVLRLRALTLSQASGRSLAIAGFVCQFALVLFGIEQNYRYLVGRPLVHPHTPALVLAFFAGANAAFAMWTAALLIRKLQGHSSQTVSDEPTQLRA